ncbi:MAG: Rrf2 family transcriptional regulator [Synergistaceae bacterium]|jgi:Rrf2 family protein|nr:Rrf2 family transcriptional regulator [Synergistaceae bacterium]
MLITRETDYALRVLRALSNGEQSTAGNICTRESLPQQFVYKILKKLEQAGFVQIARGAEGGCRLTADLKKASLYDLMEAMKAERLVSACMQPGFQCVWRQKNSGRCVVHSQLQRIQESLDAELRGHSLHKVLFGGD